MPHGTAGEIRQDFPPKDFMLYFLYLHWPEEIMVLACPSRMESAMVIWHKIVQKSTKRNLLASKLSIFHFSFALRNRLNFPFISPISQTQHLKLKILKIQPFSPYFPQFPPFVNLSWIFPHFRSCNFLDFPCFLRHWCWKRFFKSLGILFGILIICIVGQKVEIFNGA